MTIRPLEELFNGQSGGRQYVGVLPEPPAKMNDAAFGGSEEVEYYIAREEIAVQGEEENMRLVRQPDARHMALIEWANQGWHLTRN